jgi:hypothetical protein
VIPSSWSSTAGAGVIAQPVGSAVAPPKLGESPVDVVQTTSRGSGVSLGGNSCVGLERCFQKFVFLKAMHVLPLKWAEAFAIVWSTSGFRSQSAIALSSTPLSKP